LALTGKFIFSITASERRIQWEYEIKIESNKKIWKDYNGISAR
jgi:hypothetical protein